MLSRQALRLPRSPFATCIASNLRSIGTQPGKNDRAGNPYKSDQAGDPLHQQLKASKEKAENPEETTPLDAAASGHQPRHKAAREEPGGNPEGVGFVDQVGSQSSTANRTKDSDVRGGRPNEHERVGGQENITPPSFVDAVKNKLGMKTTSGEDKQNRGGGEGVTGTGKPRFDTAKRTLWTSAVNRAAASDRTTQGQAPDKSREPKERTNAEQNPHLTHKSSSAKDSGKGNAAEEPTLPSHKFNDRKSKKSPTAQQTRSFSSSARVREDEPKHTAESYFKDVDQALPSSSKTHQVDSSATGAKVQHAQEPLTGGFSRSGVGSQEYETMDRKHPYDVPPSSGPDAEQKLRYGGEPNLNSKENQNRNSHSDEGPEGASKAGRKPERRS
ncbi:unnamed protein product [Somion occarium]|uniref:Uncharacterized protein n=1 Tax=Somion occarium TaxID=3059160 RepID=A0ABP1CW57_9APHY